MVFEVRLSIAEYAECEGFEPWLGVDVLEGRIITNREFIRRSHPQGEDNPATGMNATFIVAVLALIFESRCGKL
jgi:hypothetical protein